MSIQRNKVPEPQWDKWDYAERIKHDLFSNERWGKTVEWDIILKQVEKTRQVSQMIDIKLYPSALFFAAIDLLEANLLVLDEMFYYLTGIRMTETNAEREKMQNALGFWNMDCYKVLEQISDGLIKARIPLIECLKQEPMKDITLKVIEKQPLSKYLMGTVTVPMSFVEEVRAYSYACKQYEVEQTDKEALATQIATILKLIPHYAFYFWDIYAGHMDFTKLLALFRQSEKAQTDYIEPWRHDFGGTRDSLIAKMEKDPKLGPWVNRYDHLSKGRSVEQQLFFSDKDVTSPIDKEARYNTDNWLSILTVAAVLQEYDEQHGVSSPSAAASDKDDDEDLLLRLSLYFKDEVTAMRFLSSARQMNDKEIIALVKNYQRNRLCLDASINLWRVLHDANLFKTKYNNWNAQLNKP